MKKRLLSLALAILLIGSAIPAPASAAEPAKPPPPSWILPEEYLVFEDSQTYSGEVWRDVLKLRELAATGDAAAYPEVKNFTELQTLLDKYKPSSNVLLNADAALNFEIGMIYYKLFLDGWHIESNSDSPGYSYPCFSNLMKKVEAGDAGYYTARKWAGRAYYWFAPPEGQNLRPQAFNILVILRELILEPGFNRREYLAHSDFDSVRNDPYFQKNYEILIMLDGGYITPPTPPVIKNGRTLIPIRCVAEAIGAVVEWNELGYVKINRAAQQIIVIIGDKVAMVNGGLRSMDAAPVIIDGSTFLPLRFVAETFAQTVDYDNGNNLVTITETAASKSGADVNAWLLGCGAILAEQNNKSNPYNLGMYVRNAEGVTVLQASLYSSWGINSRQTLLATVASMTDDGHNSNFAYDYALVSSLSDAEYQALLKNAQGVDTYMWPLTKALGDKWGDQEIRAWDWFRMMHLIGWGYVAGYLELQEAYDLAEPLIERLKSAFSSWDEATENYLDGYAWWSRTDVSLDKSEYKTRVKIYEELKAQQEENGLLFDPAVWK
ncbi:MAG: DUF1266 domain-containing protein [Oscillospiraceae bacterium]|nr:DUF1266 domain-containing protein [Oscillospiraceae bacterium]